MIPKPPVRKTWYRCTVCGGKVLLFDNTAQCAGVFVKCKKCAQEIEIKIEKGGQVAFHT